MNKGVGLGFGDPEVAALLPDRGYRLVGFENVLGRSPQAGARCASSSVPSVTSKSQVPPPMSRCAMERSPRRACSTRAFSCFTPAQ